VAGFAPPYQPCVYANPDADPYYQQQEGMPPQEGEERSGWREWLGIGDRGSNNGSNDNSDPAKRIPPQPAPPPPPPPSPEQQ
jgi:hypothetical protein